MNIAEAPLKPNLYGFKVNLNDDKKGRLFIDYKSDTAAQYLLKASVKELKKVENDKQAPVDLRATARRLRKKNEGEPEDKPLWMYDQWSAIELQSEMLKDLRSGELEVGTVFFKKLHALLNEKKYGIRPRKQ